MPFPGNGKGVGLLKGHSDLWIDRTAPRSLVQNPSADPNEHCGHFTWLACRKMRQKGRPAPHISTPCDLQGKSNHPGAALP
jgi:hypothetical protein